MRHKNGTFYDGTAGRNNYVMAYGPRNERTLEQNQDTNRWEYAYDELLRLQRQTDPNGTTRTPTYDAAGRVLFVNFSTGRRDSYAYDANDNPQTIARRVSGVTTATQFIYDALDRPIEQTDALAQTVQYGYDPLGRVTALTYPGGKTLTNRYDPLGRLTSQVDWAARQMTFAYDQADRLIRRAWPNGVIQTNSFDDAGRLTGLSHSPSTINSNTINIVLRYAYDRNGNKTGSSEKGTLQWPQPSLTDERADYTAAGRLKTRTVDFLSPTGGEGQGEAAIRYVYDPSGNMTNAVKMVGTTNAESWTLTYDEDNRTTSIHWDAGLTAKHIVNRYDALGRRISKTVDGVTTGCVLSLVGGMERILCDVDSSGNVTAWYVHGLDLCYRVDAANNLVCYHADAMANIISLTGTNGTNLAQYAYTPYGRSLSSSNLQSQISNPYLFVGSQGVMEELPGLYFMRARYYSAEAGVFLSTDPVKKIGPGWRPEAYNYANGNPLRFLDPDGNMTRERAAMIQGSQQEALQYELDAIRYERNANILQGFYDFLQTSESLLTGDVVGVGTGLAKQTSTLLGILGKNDWAEAVSGAADIVDFGKAAYDIGKIAKNADKLAAHYKKINGNWSRISDYSAKGPVGGMYGEVLQPLVSNGFKGIGQTAAAVINSRTTSSTGGPNSGGAVNAANHAQSLNSGQQTNPTANSAGNGTTTQSISTGTGSSGGGNNAFNRVITSITQSQTYQSVSRVVQTVTASVSQAISSAVTSIGNFFRGLF